MTKKEYEEKYNQIVNWCSAELDKKTEKLKKEMNAAAEALQFEQAALLRDRYFEIKAKL